MEQKAHHADLPLVSVIILNYKRRDALKRVLDSVLEQEYPRKEIIVVDNHSGDDLRSMIEARSSGIELIELPQNLGACGGRNTGIRKARGEILVTLDNDIYLSSPFELSKVVRTFAERPHIHVLAFQLCDPETGELRVREWCHPRSWKEFGQVEFETNFFVEGACAYRREVFEAAGLYYEPLFIYVEGYDLALRLLDRGFRILYCPQIRTQHLMAPETRTAERPYYFHSRNYIWTAYKDYRLLDGVRYLLPKMAMMVYFTLRSGHYRPFLRGVWDGITGLQRIRADRTPIRKATVEYLAQLEQGRPNLIFRLARHKTAPQL